MKTAPIGLWELGLGGEVCTVQHALPHCGALFVISIAVLRGAQAAGLFAVLRASD
jgi:hypothetical protein